MIIFTGAFPFEIAGIRKRGNFHPAGRGYFEGEIGGSPAVLAVSGIGEERAYKTAKEILGLFPNARAYVSVGLSASLIPELSPGDIVGAVGNRNRFFCFKYPSMRPRPDRRRLKNQMPHREVHRGLQNGNHLAGKKGNSQGERGHRAGYGVRRRSPREHSRRGSRLSPSARYPTAWTRTCR